MSEPLLTEALPGFRAWRVGHDGRLWAASADAQWEPGVNVARCVHGHDAPKGSCRCGLYAFHHLHRQLAREPVIGGIAAWGDMEVHRDGFRAGRATVLALADDMRFRGELRRAVERYGVPIVPRDALLPVVAERCGLLPPSLVASDDAWLGRRRGYDAEQQLWVEPGGGAVTLGISDVLAAWLKPEVTLRTEADGTLHAAGERATVVLRTGIRGEPLGPGRIAPSHWREDCHGFDWGPPGRSAYLARARVGQDGFAHLLERGEFDAGAITCWADVARELRAAEPADEGFASAAEVYDEVGIPLGGALVRAAAHLGRLDLTLALSARDPQARLVLHLRPGGVRLDCGGTAPADVTIELRAGDLRPLLAGTLDLAQAAGERRLAVRGPRSRALVALSVLVARTRAPARA